MNKLEKCIKRTNYVLGYSKPKFTEDEVSLIKELEDWQSWTPTTKYWGGTYLNKDDFYTKPQPEKPNLSAYLIEKKKMYDEWRTFFNSYYDKL